MDSVTTIELAGVEDGQGDSVEEYASENPLVLLLHSTRKLLQSAAAGSGALFVLKPARVSSCSVHGSG